MLELINNIVWGPGTVCLILSSGIYFTLKSGFFQLRKTRQITHEIFKSKEKTSFKALSAALAGTIGTGNIAGVATSMALGGPGAVFWMIVSAFFGMMTKYAEVVLAIKFREKSNGGPMYYIEKGLGQRWLGVIFAFLLAFSAFGIGNMVQANSVSAAFSDNLNIKSSATGLFMTTICFFVIIGGSKKLLSATELIVPVMAFFYMTGSVIFLIINYKNIPSALTLILSDAFNIKGISGGICGFTISNAVKYGISRGVFTNEAGLGSSPIAHACAAKTILPARQGLWGIFEVFFDTVAMCFITSLVILTAENGSLLSCGLSGIDLTVSAFETVFGSFGGVFISVSMMFFAAATIFGWCFYAEKAVSYITNDNKTALFIYKFFYITAIYIGSVMSLETVWTISDILNGLMIFPNITALFMLRKCVFEETKKL